MLGLRKGDKLLCKSKVFCLTGENLAKGSICKFKNAEIVVDSDGDNLVELVLTSRLGEHHTEVKLKYWFLLFGKYNEIDDTEEYEMSLEELQAAYNSVVMTENGYMPKSVQNQFKGTLMQEGKSGEEKEIEALIEALEEFNEENYKESAINIALDEKDERKFMELTED